MLPTMSPTMESRIVRAAEGPQNGVQGAGAQGLTESWLLALDEGPGNFDVRYIRLQAGGVSRDHAHPHEQANYILSGQAQVRIDGEDHSVGRGDFVYFAGNARHSFRNTGEEELVMLTMRGPQQ